jgi:hypothetical protein
MSVNILAHFKQKINQGDLMITSLNDGAYYLLYVEYDSKLGNHYFLREQKSRCLIHFWDKEKIMHLKFIPSRTFFEKVTINTRVYINIIRSAF